MKKLLGVLLCLMLICGITGCAKTEIKATGSESTSAVETEMTAPSSSAVQAVPEDTAAEDSHILVAYFSQTGNTKLLAEYAAAYYGAELYEITPKEPYTEADLNCNDSGSRTTKEQNNSSARPEIEGIVADMEQFDTIALAYPIWWGQAPRIISTFLETYDFSGKTIIPFCTSASSGIGSSDDNLHTLASSSTHWIDGKRFAQEQLPRN